MALIYEAGIIIGQNRNLIVLPTRKEVLPTRKEIRIEELISDQNNHKLTFSKKMIILVSKKIQ